MQSSHLSRCRQCCIWLQNTAFCCQWQRMPVRRGSAVRFGDVNTSNSHLWHASAGVLAGQEVEAHPDRLSRPTQQQAQCVFECSALIVYLSSRTHVCMDRLIFLKASCFCFRKCRCVHLTSHAAALSAGDTALLARTQCCICAHAEYSTHRAR